MKIQNKQTGLYAEKIHPMKWGVIGFEFDDDLVGNFNKNSILRWVRIEAEDYQVKMCKLSWRFISEHFNDIVFVDGDISIDARSFIEEKFPKWF